VPSSRSCGLTSAALRRLDLDSLDLLFIENVGTLADPASPDLGHAAAAVVFSVAAGHDVAARHPHLVAAADVILLNKVDLLADVPFDLAAFLSDVRRLNPGAQLIEVSTRDGTGIDRWTRWLKSRLHGGVRDVLDWFK
jgi:hydrogenase nickel incorporation protein HypB